MATRRWEGAFFRVIHSPGCVYITFTQNPHDTTAFRSFFDQLGPFLYEPKAKFALLADLSQLGPKCLLPNYARIVSQFIDKHRPQSAQYLDHTAVSVESALGRNIVHMAFSMGNHTRPFQVFKDLKSAQVWLGWSKS